MAINNTPKKRKSFKIKAYSLSELAEIYGVTRKTMLAWVKAMPVELGPRIGHLYNPKQVSFIQNHLGSLLTWLGTWLVKMMMGDFTGENDGQDEGKSGK